MKVKENNKLSEDAFMMVGDKEIIVFDEFGKVRKFKFDINIAEFMMTGEKETKISVEEVEE